MFPKIFCASKDELITILNKKIREVEHKLPLSEKEMLKTINMREQIGGTLFPSGLSVPHARLQNFEDFVLAIGIPAQPLFHEGIEIRMAAIMITSQTGSPWYLSVLAALTKISRDSAYFSRLCKAETPEEFLRILKEKKIELE